MTLYRKYSDRLNTPQSEVIPGRDADMGKNAAGGFAFNLDDWSRLDRFLILGTEGGTYYTSESKLTRDNAKNLERCVGTDGLRVVRTVVEVSKSGRAPKNDPALFALAMAAGIGDDATRAEALNVLPEVARIGTHLFQFAEFVEGFRGWGRGLRKAVARWYEDKSSSDLQYQLIKYQSRYGWSHRDLMRLSHPKPVGGQDYVFNYVTFQGSEDPDRVIAYEQALAAIKENKWDDLTLLQGVELVKGTDDPKAIAGFISKYNLPREVIPTEFLNDTTVWEALLEKMPMTALIRNLGKLSNLGLLAQGKFDVVDKVTSQITNEVQLRKARVHPINLLVALETYKTGRGLRGSLTWKPVQDVIDALDSAFYMAFENVVPSNKRTYIGLDVSGSMTVGNIAGTPLTPNVAAAAMCMVTYKAESMCVVKGFSSSMVEIDFSRKSRLDSVIKATNAMSFGSTDCALPMYDALDSGLEIDTFIIYTDNETWAGRRGHPAQALAEYRKKMNIPAKLIVVGMTATGFTVADPKDAGMLDVVGFDTAAPQAISQFSSSDF